MTKDKYEKRDYSCPMGKFLGDVERAFDKKSGFFQHMNQSQIEFLRGIKSLVDGRIETLEEKIAREEKAAKTKTD